MRNPPELSIVIPCFRSEQNLPQLATRVEETMSSLGVSFEVVLVDDGSPDGTWQVILDLTRKHRFVRGFRLMRNYGQHNALLCGIRAARGATLVTMDDDLQNPPEEIPRLLAKFKEGYDVVYGSPQRESHGFLRDIASQVTKLVLQKSMGAATARNISAFRVFHTRLRDAFADYRGAFVSIDVLLTWGGARFAAIQVRNDRRPMGTSNYTVYKLISHALNMMTGFGTAPLQLASLLGFLFTLVGIAIFLYVVGGYLMHGSPVQGFPFLASAIAIFSGAQLFALGIIGEYLARVHVRVMDRPSFAVDAATDEEMSNAG